MNSFGALTFLAAGLQLTIPSYALRLVRRFGAQRVGWFIVMSFFSLALLHTLRPPKAFPSGASLDTASNLVFIAASVLLLVGMGHVETLCAQRMDAQRQEEKRRREWESEIEEQTTELANARQQLARDLADRDQRERALQHSVEQYRLLFAENPEPMWIFSPQTGGFLDVNQAALRQYGFTREEFLGLSMLDLVQGGAPETPSGVPGASERGAISSHRRKDQRSLDVEMHAQDVEFGGEPARLVIATDAGPRLRGQRDALEAQKIKLIGQVAGGVAHHFNNLLTIVSCEANLLLRDTKDASAEKGLQQICDAVKRASGLTSQLMAAAGRQPMQPKNLDMNALLRRLTPMLRRLVGDRIELTMDCGAHVRPICGDSRLLERVIVNLILNAREAMPKGGTLSLATSAVKLDARAVEGHLNAKPGNYVRLTIRDSGVGLAPETQGRLFEPFFTTRDVGQGLGLGLASSNGTVRQHGGWIEASSDNAVGTEFRVFLPCTTEQEAQTGGATSDATVLLLEPDDNARNAARFMLSWNGYRVIEVDSVETIQAVWESQASRVDLALIPLRLSGDLSGPALAEHLRQIRPGLKVAFSVNDADPGALPEAGLAESAKVIPKPFEREGLLAAVQRCLDQGAS